MCRTGRVTAQKRRSSHQARGSPHSCSSIGNGAPLPPTSKRARLSAQALPLPLTRVHVDTGTAAGGLHHLDNPPLPNAVEQQLDPLCCVADHQCLEEFMSQLPGLEAEDWQIVCLGQPHATGEAANHL